MKRIIGAAYAGNLKRISVFNNFNIPGFVPVPDVDIYYVRFKVLNIVVIFSKVRVPAGEVHSNIFLDLVHVVGAELVIPVVSCSLIIMCKVFAAEIEYSDSSGSTLLADVDAGCKVSRPPPGSAHGAVVMFVEIRREGTVEHTVRMAGYHIDVVAVKYLKEGLFVGVCAVKFLFPAKIVRHGHRLVGSKEDRCGFIHI